MSDAETTAAAAAAPEPEVGPNHVTPDKAAERIAASLPLTFDMTFPHPQHGPLRFEGGLPKAPQLLRHRLETDKLLGQAGDDVVPGFESRWLAASMAALAAGLLSTPVLREERTTEPNEAGGERITITKVLYDPAEELHATFLMDVWAAYSAWRNELASEAVVTTVGKDSGASPGSA